MYRIAQEEGRVGHVEDNLRAQIVLGLKKGYGGVVQEKEEALTFLTDSYKESLKAGGNYIPFVITDAVVTYAFRGDEGPVAEHEPSLVLTADKSPLYGDESDEEWQILVEEYAVALATRFDQYRVYVSYTRAERKIFQRS